MNITRQPSTNKYVAEKEKITKLFDIKTLDLYCRYIISSNSNIKISSLELVKSLFDKVIISDYGNDTERVNRINFIRKGLEARVIKHLNSRDLIVQYINGGIVNDQLLDISGYDEISDDELSYINEQSCILSESYFIDGYYNQITKLSSDLKNGSGVDRAGAVNEIRTLVQKMNSTFNRIESSKNIEPEFSLYGDDFDSTFRDIFARETSPSRTLKTGLAGLNQMIGGGFQSGRVYIFFGTAATGKSFFALDMALQIMKYNSGYKTKDPTKKPCVVFLTMENSVQENISRVFNMITGNQMANFTSYDDAVGLFKNALSYYSKSDSINIYMEYQPNLSQSTNYLYQLVDKIKARNEEPICIIVDHIKRIRSIDQTRDMRLDLGNIVNEFKAFANMNDIPVITISHLNREAAKNIGENKNKKDIIRSLGANNVSDSILLIDNCDVGIILNKEADSKGKLYMGFSSIKTRTQCDIELFFQPFMQDHALKLVEDAESTVPVYKWTLIDRESGPLRRQNNDYVKSEEATRRLDDEDLFSSNTLASLDNGEAIVNSGYGMMSFPQEQPSQGYNYNPAPPPPQLSFREELVNMKYTTDGKVAFYILNNDGEVIGDSVEMYS